MVYVIQININYLEYQTSDLHPANGWIKRTFTVYKVTSHYTEFMGTKVHTSMLSEMLW